VPASFFFFSRAFKREEKVRKKKATKFSFNLHQKKIFTLFHIAVFSYFPQSFFSA